MLSPKAFAAITGAVVGGTGILGMIAPLRKETLDRREELKFDTGYGNIAGVIPTNTVFNWVRVGIGVAGLVSARDDRSAVIFNRAVAIAYGGMAVMGLIPKADTVFGLMPIFGGNVALHGGTAMAELFTEDRLIDQARKVLPFQKRNNSSVNEAVYR